MNSFGAARKRGRPQGAIGNGPSFKKPKELVSSQPGLGSKSKPCTKFFSTAGCPFGEGCHFLHYVPGGYAALSQMPNMGNHTLNPASRNPVGGPPPMSDGPPTSAAKTRLCNKFNTPEGCKFGDKCHFAHGERELGRPFISGHETPIPHMGGGRLGGRFPEPPPQLPTALGLAASFGASATAKISVDASLAGAIIGKGGVNTKQVCRMTGAKLSIRDHESDQNLRNIELEGTFDQIKQATAMVRELIVSIGSSAPAAPAKPAIGFGMGSGGLSTGGLSSGGPSYGPGSGNFKTKLCESFSKGTCTFGDRCHFAHGASELLRKTA